MTLRDEIFAQLMDGMDGTPVALAFGAPDPGRLDIVRDFSTEEVLGMLVANMLNVGKIVERLATEIDALRSG